MFLIEPKGKEYLIEAIQKKIIELINKYSFKDVNKAIKLELIKKLFESDSVYGDLKNFINQYNEISSKPVFQMFTKEKKK